MIRSFRHQLRVECAITQLYSGTFITRVVC